MRMNVVVGVVWVDLAGEVPARAVAPLLASCTAALAPGRCALGPAPDGKPGKTASVRFDALQVVVDLADGERGSPLRRELRLEPDDPPAERGRAVGLVIAVMVQTGLGARTVASPPTPEVARRRESEPKAPAAPPSRRPPAAPAVASVSHRDLDPSPRLPLGVYGAAALAEGSGGLRLGGGATLLFDPGDWPLQPTLDARYLLSDGPRGTTLGYLGLSLGLRGEIRSEPWRAWLEGAGVLERTTLSIASESASHLVGGARLSLGVERSWHPVSPFLALDLTGTAPHTLLVSGLNAGTTASLATTLALGARLDLLDLWR